MQTLEINDETAEQLKQLANEAHISTSQFIEQLLLKYTQDKEPTTLEEFFGILKDSPTFKGDPVEIQRRIRDEWER